VSAGDGTDLGAAILEIEALDRDGCRARWFEAFGAAADVHLSAQFMRRVLVWELQCRELGGVSGKTDRRLTRIAAGQPVTAIARPGAHLVREWNGRTYRVAVVAGGFEMDGKTYRSLSAIAKRITGAHWSGPRFFGVG
jgi:hypothetical protein